MADAGSWPEIVHGPYPVSYTHLILFVSQRVTDGRKGMRYFIEAIDRLVARYPAMKENTAIALLGGHSEEVNLTLPSYSLGYVSDEKQIVAIYNSADAFVLPSQMCIRDRQGSDTEEWQGSGRNHPFSQE